MKLAEFQGLLDGVVLSGVLFCCREAFKKPQLTRYARWSRTADPLRPQKLNSNTGENTKSHWRATPEPRSPCERANVLAARCLMEMGKASAWSTPGGTVNGLDNCQPPLPTGGESILWSGPNKKNQGVISLLMRSVDLCWAHTQRDNYDNKAIRILE